MANMLVSLARFLKLFYSIIELNAYLASKERASSPASLSPTVVAAREGELSEDDIVAAREGALMTREDFQMSTAPTGNAFIATLSMKA